MNDRFPKKWYECIFIILTGTIVFPQAYMSVMQLFNVPEASSPLVPAYAWRVVLLKNLALATAGILGLAGIIACMAGKKVGWTLLISSAAFFIYLFGFFALQDLIEGNIPVISLAYACVLIVMLGLLLRRTTRNLFAVNPRQFIMVGLAGAALIFAFADAHPIILFFI